MKAIAASLSCGSDRGVTAPADRAAPRARRGRGPPEARRAARTRASTAAACALVWTRASSVASTSWKPDDPPVGQHGVDATRRAGPASAASADSGTTRTDDLALGTERRRVVRDRHDRTGPHHPEIEGGLAVAAGGRAHRIRTEMTPTFSSVEIRKLRSRSRTQKSRRATRRHAPRSAPLTTTTSRNSSASVSRTGAEGHDVARAAGEVEHTLGVGRGRELEHRRRPRRPGPTVTPGTTSHQSPSAPRTSTRHRFRSREACSASIVPRAATRPLVDQHDLVAQPLDELQLVAREDDRRRRRSRASRCSTPRARRRRRDRARRTARRARAARVRGRARRRAARAAGCRATATRSDRRGSPTTSSVVEQALGAVRARRSFGTPRSRAR